MGTPGATTQAVTMKSFVLSSLFACGLAAPTTHVNSGVPVGPLTPAFGDAVQTPKGLRSLALEGFSEDLNQDGFVDPIGQAVVAAPVASLLLLPSLPPLLLRRLLESRWLKREIRPVEVQKQQTVSLSDCFLCNQCNKTKK